jgi:hypothetical protein
MSVAVVNSRRATRRHLVLLAALVACMMSLPAAAHAASWHGPTSITVGTGATTLAGPVQGVNMVANDPNMCVSIGSWNCSSTLLSNGVQYLWASIGGNGNTLVWNGTGVNQAIMYWLFY